MTHALLKGADGTSKRERGLRLQPEAPEFLTRSSAKPDYLTCIAESLPRQEENRKPVRPAVDAATREITNYGHLMQVIAGIHALKKIRYGQKRAPADAARDLYRALAAVEAAAASRNPKFAPDLREWSDRHLCLNDVAKAEIRAELVDHTPIITARFLGEQLGLTDAERDLADFRRAEAVDMTAEDRDAKRRAKDAERRRQDRRKRGVPPKGEHLALARQLRPDASQSTLTRLARKLKGKANA